MLNLYHKDREKLNILFYSKKSSTFACGKSTKYLKKSILLNFFYC